MAIDMLRYFLPPPRWLLITGFALLYAFLSLFVMQQFVRASNALDSSNTTFEAMVDGDQQRPYVYRFLLPQTVSLIMALTPNRVERDIEQALMELRQYPMPLMLAGFSPGLQNNVFFYPDLLYMRLLGLGLAYLCLAGYVVMMYLLGRALFPDRLAAALSTPVVALLFIPGFSSPTFYIYDFAVLFFCAGGYYFLYKQRWVAYLFFFFLACLNKETTIFLLLFFTLWAYGRLPWKRFCALWLVQACVLAAVKLAVNRWFEGNPGGLVETYHWQHVNALLAGYHYKGFFIGCMAMMAFTWRWNDKPLYARYGLWVVPAMAAAYGMYGYPDELRVFFDIFPLLTILVTHTMVVCSGIADSPTLRHYDQPGSKTACTTP